MSLSVVAYSAGSTQPNLGVPMSRDRYGCFSFLFDIMMVGVTAGLWLIWIFVREMRRG